jgi:hypothetical protein
MIQRFKRGGKFGRLCFVISGEQFKGRPRIADAPRRIDARSKGKTNDLNTMRPLGTCTLQ